MRNAGTRSQTEPSADTGPSFLAPGRPRYEAITFGAMLGATIGVWMEGPTLYWRHVMLVPLHLQLDGVFFLPFEGAFGVTGETIVGFGGHHGPQDKYSHWGLLGAGAGYRQSFDIFEAGTTQMVTLLLLAGYDFRWHFGEDLRRVWGIRVYVGWMPKYWARYHDIECDNALFCTDRAPRVVAPVVAAVAVFIGLR